jgi:hypothetical protein
VVAAVVVVMPVAVVVTVAIVEGDHTGTTAHRIPGLSSDASTGALSLVLSPQTHPSAAQAGCEQRPELRRWAFTDTSLTGKGAAHAPLRRPHRERRNATASASIVTKRRVTRSRLRRLPGCERRRQRALHPQAQAGRLRAVLRGRQTQPP